jgi:hypothetical protein
MKLGRIHLRSPVMKAGREELTKEELHKFKK